MRKEEKKEGNDKAEKSGEKEKLGKWRMRLDSGRRKIGKR